MNSSQKLLSKYYEEVDSFALTTGNPIAMNHRNYRISEIYMWVHVLLGKLSLPGIDVDWSELFGLLFSGTLCGDLMVVDVIRI